MNCLKRISLMAVAGMFVASFMANRPGTSTQQEKQPNIKFFKTTHNFGSIKEGPKYEYDFRFVNTGNAPLLINRVKTACSCVTPDWPGNPVAQGDTATIEIDYFSDNRPGKFFKAVQVLTNVPDKSLRILYVKGEVKPVE